MTIVLRCLRQPVVLLLMAALLVPVFAFGRLESASAKTVAPTAVLPIAPSFAAPPVAFAVNPGITTVPLNAFDIGNPSGGSFSPGAIITSGYAAVVSFFTAPPLPEGFGIARSVSPAFALTSSVAASIGAFFGLIEPASAAINRKVTSAADSTDSSSLAADSNDPQSAEMTMLAAPIGTVAFDFDGDGKADLARRKPSNSEWKIKKSAANGAITTVTVGTSAARPAPADFDGDGITDPATFTAANGFWTGVLSSNGTTATATFGTTGDIPVPADYDGDGHSDIAIFRPSSGTWTVSNSSNGAITTTAFGTSGDIPVPGNYDGDSKADFAVFRPSNGTWYTLGSTAGINSCPWGLVSDVPVQADYDGDGKTDFAVYRPSSGGWYILKSSSGANLAYWNFNWGNYGDQPAPADYDGDGKADLALFRPTTNVWHIEKSCAYTNSCAANTTPYSYQSFGAAGDQAIPAAYLKQVGGMVSGDALNAARLSPKNATGGTDLYSQNFSWGTALAELPGRAGLNAGFGIGYNSLVWTKYTEPSTNTQTIVYDADQSNVTPGFNFGFPTIEPAYFDAASSTFNYLMVSPSGSRTRFVQMNGASDTYETQDSSYLQLKTTGAANANDPAENITITVSGTDGTRMTYLYKAGAFHCSEIKDRNGNYLTIGYTELGLLQTVTDTLGRTLTVYYDEQLSPSAITEQMQSANGSGAAASHTLVLFSYETMPLNPTFDSNIAVIGPGAGATVKILRNIAFDSGANTYFYYNKFGQVYKVLNTAPDGHYLNYVRTNLADADLGSTAKTDVPRFTETRSWIENFNRAPNNGAEQETVITNSLAPNQSYSVGGASGTGTLIQVAMANEPNGHYSKTYVGAAGWQEGLPLATEDWANGANGTERKRWTSTVWTQDNPNASAQLQNPRQIESRVGDTSNVKRMTTDYLMANNSPTVSYFGLPKEMKVYDADQTTVLKTAKSYYNLDAAYTNRRIIGLPSKSELYDQSGALMSKMTYAYDEGDFSDSSLGQNLSTAIAHDNTNFGASFVAGRANQTSMTRWDVSGQTANVTSTVKYNTTGAPVAQSDPLGRTVKISYADSFSDNVNSRNTFAYPTTLTDPAGNSSFVKYRYDLGLNVWAQSPAPAGNTVGKVSTREFDSIGRISKEAVVNTGAYIRYEYPTNSIQSKVYSTVVDTNNNGADANDEVLSESWADGAGRVLRSRTPLPNSIGGYSGQLTEYDVLGQIKRSSVPTEINSAWNPAGDDANRGFLWTANEYDWKGRTTKTVNTDGTDKLMSYEGCGCAGGQVTTMQGELVARDDQPTATGRRTQRVYDDILGRTYKSESLNWDGGIYATTKTTFNGRDQTTLVRQYSGADTSSTYQDTTMTYDGHGRLKTQHRPEQNAGTATVYNYNQDDRISTMTDARSVTTVYTYENRGLLEQINYTSPNGFHPYIIPAAAPVSFTYDNLGNRTQMTDGLGTVQYEYNQLSQLTAEARQFSDLPSAPTPDHKYKLQYSYTLGGQLKSLTDPSGLQINYGFDQVGRLNQVTGTLAGNTITYANNPQYRAWGALKHLDYGNGTQSNITNFNNRLQGTDYEVKNASNDLFIKKQYQFYADGSLKYSQDQTNAKFDRSYKYDHLSRLTEARTGAEARGTTDSPGNIPYSQNYTYNAFSNKTQTQAHNYSSPLLTTSYNFVNDRGIPENVGGSGPFDAEGNEDYLYAEDGGNIFYNAAGLLDLISGDGGYNVDPKIIRRNFGNDGDGHQIKVSSTERTGNDPEVTESTYKVISTVLGGEVIAELYTNGLKKHTFIRANGTVLAQEYNDAYQRNTIWSHKDPSLSTMRSSTAEGQMFTQEGGDIGKLELDPQGNNVGFSDWWYENSLGTFDTFGNIGEFPSFETIQNGQLVRYAIDGISVPGHYFNSRVDAAFGGVFGLIEHQARISAPRYTVNDVWGLQAYSGTSWKQARAAAYQTETLTVNRTFEESWSVNLSLVAFGDTQGEGKTLYARQLDGGEVKKLRMLVGSLLSREKCAHFIENLLDKAQELAGNRGIDRISERLFTHDILSIFDRVNSEGGYFAGGQGASTIKGTLDYGMTDTPAQYLGASFKPAVLLSQNYYFPRGPQDPQPPVSKATNSYNERQLFSASNGGLSTLHELIHFNFHDIPLAEALRQMTGDTKTEGFHSIAEEGKWTDAETARASSYWNNALKENCDPNYKPK